MAKAVTARRTHNRAQGLVLVGFVLAAAILLTAQVLRANAAPVPSPYIWSTDGGDGAYAQDDCGNMWQLWLRRGDTKTCLHGQLDSDRVRAEAARRAMADNIDGEGIGYLDEVLREAFNHFVHGVPLTW